MKQPIFLFLILLSSTSYSQSLDWVKNFDDDDQIRCRTSATDQYDNIYLAGNFHGTVDFDPSTNVYELTTSDETFSWDPYIQKLDPNGNLIWAKSFGGLSDEQIKSIAVDAEGAVYVTGRFSEMVDFDPSDSEAIGISNYSDDIFILKLNSDGEFLWVLTIVGHGFNSGEGITIDDANNIYVTGFFHGAMNLSSTGSTILSGIDEARFSTFIIKLTSNGTLAWARSITNENSSIITTAIGLDSFQNIYCGGRFTGITDFDPGAGSFLLTPNGAFGDSYILKLSSTGNFIWVRSFGAMNKADKILDIAIDQSNNVISLGSTGAPVFGADTNTTEISEPLFDQIDMHKMNSEGDSIWSKSFGGVKNDMGKQIRTDTSSNIYILGDAGGQTDLDPSYAVFPLGPFTFRNSFISKYDSDGNMIWTLPDSSEMHYDPSAITVDSQGKLIIAGRFEQSTDFDPSSGSDVINAGYIKDNFIQKLRPDTCGDLSLLFSASNPINCSNHGNAVYKGIHGTPPYTFHWNPDIETSDSSSIFITPGSYELTIVDSTGCTASKTLNVDGPGDLGPFNFDANLVTYSFQTGMSTSILLDAYNSGCERPEATLTLVPDELTTIQGYSIPPDEINADSLIWNFTDLTFDDAHFISNIAMTVDTLAAIGDTVCFDLIIQYFESPDSSITTTKQYCSPIRNAYDPNDMQVNPKGVCSENYITSRSLTSRMQG